MTEIRIHGLGGQGAVTLAHLLVQAAVEEGRQAQALPSFGVERRGAPVRAAVRVADKPIRVFSASKEPHRLVLMDKQLLNDAISEGMAKEPIILVNSATPLDAPCPVLYVDAASIAEEYGLVGEMGPFINIPMLGASANLLGISAEVLEKTIRSKMQGPMAEKNVEAALSGYHHVSKVAVQHAD